MKLNISSMKKAHFEKWSYSHKEKDPSQHKLNSTGLYKVYELGGTFSLLKWQELTVNTPIIHK